MYCFVAFTVVGKNIYTYKWLIKQHVGIGHVSRPCLSVLPQMVAKQMLADADIRARRNHINPV